MRKTVNFLCAAGLAVVGVTAGITAAEAGDHYVYKMLYKNNGAYIVDWVEVFWEYNGDKKSEKYSKNIGNGDGFCFNADKWNADNEDKLIPEGAEMHLRINIEHGDQVNCEKNDAKFYYKDKSNGGGEAYFKTAGQTKTNNDCQIDNFEDTTISGNC